MVWFNILTVMCILSALFMMATIGDIASCEEIYLVPFYGCWRQFLAGCG